MTDVDGGQVTVVASNLSMDVNEALLQNFFGFCGEILSIRLITFQNEEDVTQTKTAFISFARETAARTALLLNKAVINNRPVHITSFKQAPSVEPASTTATSSTKAEVATAQGAEVSQILPPKTEQSNSAGPSAPVSPEDITQEDKPKLLIVEELLQRGYQLTGKIIQDARAFDEQYGISERFLRFVEQGRQAGAELNERYQLATRGQAVLDQLTTGVQRIYTQVDSQYHVQEHVQRLGEAALITAAEFDQRYHVTDRIHSFFAPDGTNTPGHTSITTSGSAPIDLISSETPIVSVSTTSATANGNSA